MASTGLTHAAWLEDVPDLLARWSEIWSLRLGEPYTAGAAGVVVRAELPDGTPAVLTLAYPHREAEHAADALEVWDGNGAVRLLARSDDGWAMLPRLWKPAHAPFPGSPASAPAGGRSPKPLPGRSTTSTASVARRSHAGC